MLSLGLTGTLMGLFEKCACVFLNFSKEGNFPIYFFKELVPQTQMHREAVSKRLENKSPTVPTIYMHSGA